MRRAVYGALGALMGLTACAGPIPLPDTAQAPVLARASDAPTEIVVLRTYFASGVAHGELGQARCVVTQAGHRTEVVTPARVGVATAGGAEIMVTCTALIGAGPQKANAVHPPLDPPAAARARRIYPATIGVYFN